jgi:hypothetical protein
VDNTASVRSLGGFGLRVCVDRGSQPAANWTGADPHDRHGRERPVLLRSRTSTHYNPVCTWQVFRALVVAEPVNEGTVTFSTNDGGVEGCTVPVNIGLATCRNYDPEAWGANHCICLLVKATYNGSGTFAPSEWTI